MVEGEMAPVAAAAVAANSGGGLLVAAACGGRQGAVAGVRPAVGQWPGLIFLFTVHLFFRVSETMSCAMSTLPAQVCCVHVAECCTRQSFCRVQYGLCRVPQAHGKLLDSGSVWSKLIPSVIHPKVCLVSRGFILILGYMVLYIIKG